MQSFHYIVDVYPLYLLSKAWPIVTLPLALLALRNPPAYTRSFIILLIYILVVPPALTMVYFSQSYASALTGTVKILPFFYYFSVSFVLDLLRPSRRDLELTFNILGAANLGLLAALWVFVPVEFYRSGAIGEEISKLFIWEQERGYRITLPLVFGFIFMFLQLRTAVRDRSLPRLFLPIAGLCLLFVAYKQRTVIGGIVAILGYGSFKECTPRLRLALLGGGLVVASTAAFTLPLQDFLSNPATLRVACSSPVDGFSLVRVSDGKSGALDLWGRLPHACKRCHLPAILQSPQLLFG